MANNLDREDPVMYAQSAGAWGGARRRSYWEGEASNQGRRGCGDFHARRVNDPISYNRLQQWNQLDDPDKQTLELLGSKDHLIDLLNSTCMNGNVVNELIQLFSKICKSKIRQSMLSVLALLRDSIFTSKHIPNQMVVWGIDEDENKKKEMVKSMIQLMAEFLRCFPSSFNDMPLDALQVFVTKIKNGQELEQQVLSLAAERDLLLKKKLQTKVERARDKYLYKPPPNNFREIKSYPTVQEIISRQKPYLRPILKKGSYHDGEHYLDVQFRLLKEDLVCPLREGIHEVTDDIPRQQRKHALKVYSGVKILHVLCTKAGLIYRICFDTTYTQGIPWKHSRRLIFGSLVCLSKDTFQTMIFATVANRNLSDLENGILDIRFIERDICQAYIRGGESMSMVQSASYYEAYKHVLNGIKQIDVNEIPMYDYVVGCRSQVDIPKYLKGNQNPKYWLKHIRKSPTHTETHALKECLKLDNFGMPVEVLNDHKWPEYQETTLNESQLKALKHALTKEFVIIQGPPGTGKTHVGLRIADALIRNKQFCNRHGMHGEETGRFNNHTIYTTDNTEKPILIVCYTNHALDQFLKGLFDLGHQNIVRVGGRASDEIEKFSLRNAMIESNLGNTHIKNAMSVSYSLRETILDEIKPYIDSIKYLCESLAVGKVLNLFALEDVINSRHVSYFDWLDLQCQELSISIFEIFLGLYQIPPELLVHMQLIDVFNLGEEKNGQQLPNPEEKLQVHNSDGGQQQDMINMEGETPIDRRLADSLQYEILQNQRADGLQDKENCGSVIFDKDGFQTVQPKRQQRKRQIQQHLETNEMMTDIEADGVNNPWELKMSDRWRLYKYWIHLLESKYAKYVEDKTEAYENVCERINEIQEQEEELVLRQASVIAMTTTCAAKYRPTLNKIKPKIVIIEEAAEVLEAHVITSLSNGTEHLILIGDHKQLKPNPSVFELAKDYSLDISLFERMINNDMECHTLDVQHRMRPEIARLVHHVYPNLRDHSSVTEIPDVRGVLGNLVFITHAHQEKDIGYLKSKANQHEAEFLKSFCRYLMQQGYKAQQITILTGYTGQLITMKSIMPKSEFDGVRVTTVDNFQGEENDIILLSLVRSNLDSKIGFLRMENRVCVALSRAKQGLYVIGNFEMLEEASPLWKKVVADVRDRGALKDHIELCCQNHPNTKMKVRKERDFFGALEGGCTKPCEFRFECGHSCQMKCHPIDQEHKKYVCKKTCIKIVCDEGHVCNSQCHHGKECPACLVPIERVMPECGHRQTMECSKDPSSFTCKAKCNTKACNEGHVCNSQCHHGKECPACIVPVERVMSDCDHWQTMECWKDPSSFICKAKCDKIACDESHICNSQCHHDKECPACLVPVERVVPGCGHRQLMGCWEASCSFICKEKCERIRRCGHACTDTCGDNCEDLKCLVINKYQLQCGHTYSVPCHKDTQDHCCQEKCGALLDCGHTCVGACGLCKQGRLHIKCRSECKRALICSHLCIRSCTSDCPPCKTKCQNYCNHKKCLKTCRELCVPCDKPCAWKCLHHECTNNCGELCNRRRCNKPCNEKLPCGHDCIGLCGEFCPDLCRVCNRDKVEQIFFGTECDMGARFVVLSDCMHIFEASALDSWMETAEGNEVKLKRCPRCRRVVWRSLRYGNIVKNILKNIDEIKQKILHNETLLQDLKARAALKCLEVNLMLDDASLRKTEERTIKLMRLKIRLGLPLQLESGHGSGSMLFKQIQYSRDIRDVRRVLNQATILESVLKLQQNPYVDNLDCFNSLFADLEQYLLEKLSKQQIQQAVMELRRVQLYIETLVTTESLQRKLRISDDSLEQLRIKQDYRKINSIYMQLKEGKPIAKEDFENMLRDVNKIQNRNSTRLTGKTEKPMIIRTPGFEASWFKCKKGHYYSIEDYRVAIERVSCSDCETDNDGTSCRLVGEKQDEAEFGRARAALYLEEENCFVNPAPE